MTVLPSYRNQSIDLHRKSIDWFLYEGGTGIKWVNSVIKYLVRFRHHLLVLRYYGMSGEKEGVSTLEGFIWCVLSRCGKGIIHFVRTQDFRKN